MADWCWFDEKCVCPPKADREILARAVEWYGNGNYEYGDYRGYANRLPGRTLLRGILQTSLCRAYWEDTDRDDRGALYREYGAAFRPKCSKEGIT